MYDGCLLEATLLIPASETVKDIIKFKEYCTTHVAKQISITGNLAANQIKRRLSDVSKHATSIQRQDKQKRRIANFVYNAENDIFAKMIYLQHCTTESLFLKEGEVDTIFNTIALFLICCRQPGLEAAGCCMKTSPGAGSQALAQKLLVPAEGLAAPAQPC